MGLFGSGALPKRNSLADLVPAQPFQPNGLLGLAALAGQRPQQPNYGNRPDGTPKGRGFLGELRMPDGRVMTEFSVGVDWGEGEQEIPTLVPSLSPQEIEHLRRGGQPTDAIIDKAVKYARKRRFQGLSPFATPGIDY